MNWFKNALLAALICAAPLVSAETIANAEHLRTAFRAASGGETFTLEPGHYGDLRIEGRDFPSYVTILSSDAHNPAVFNSISIVNSGYIRIDGVHVSNDSNGSQGSKVVEIIDGSHDVEFLNSQVHGRIDDDFTGHFGIFSTRTKDIVIHGNKVHDVKTGIVNFGVDGLVVSDNFIGAIGEDAFKFSIISDFSVMNNRFFGHVFHQPGAHLDFIQFQGEARNGVIKGNIFLANGVAYIQGIFMSDAEYHDIIIEGNLIYTGMSNGIVISSGSGNKIINNTVLNAPDLVHPASGLRVADGTIVENNIITRKKGGMVGTNLILQHVNPAAPYHYSKFFVNAEAGLTITLQDLAIIPGSLAETTGSFATPLQELGLDPSEQIGLGKH